MRCCVALKIMKIQFVSMRKYKMCLTTKYRLKHLFSINRYFDGKVIQFRILCEWGFDIDFRQGSIIDLLLTEKEKQQFYVRWFSKRN